jgi:putative peptidoglycan binding protein
MKKFTSLLIVCSLALAGAAMAQQPEEQQSPTKKQGAEKTQPAEPKTPKTRGENLAKPEATAKTHAAETKSGANLASPEATAPTQHGAMKERGASKVPKADTATQTGAAGQPTGSATIEPGAGKGRKAHEKSATSAGTETNVSGEATASATPGGKQGKKGMKEMKGAGANAKASPSATPVTAATASATPVTAASPSGTPATAASASAAPTVAGAGQQNAQATGAAAAQKPDPQKVQQVKAQAQQIKQQHVNFRAQPRPDKVPAVTFNANFRIEGSDRWQGPQYEVYRSYHPERHDRGWYHSRYQRVELIGGGYYYWNNGYWYPAWGYDPSAEYYAYDAPIYVGHRAEPPDRVIADVQAELQQMGYYRGEVDGLLGPLTREALTAYQADQGLATTAVIDEPTLDSLGMG